MIALVRVQAGKLKSPQLFLQREFNRKNCLLRLKPTALGAWGSTAEGDSNLSGGGAFGLEQVTLRGHDEAGTGSIKGDQKN